MEITSNQPYNLHLDKFRSCGVCLVSIMLLHCQQLPFIAPSTTCIGFDFSSKLSVNAASLLVHFSLCGGDL